MIYFFTFITTVLSIWLGWRKSQIAHSIEGEASKLADRLVEAAFWPVIAVTIIGLIYSVLSLPILSANLDDLTIAQLRELEARIPIWTKDVADWMPKWHVFFILAVISLLLSTFRRHSTAPTLGRVAQTILKIIQRVRSAQSAMTAVTCGLFAASALTLFGDGLKDEGQAILSKIHMAEIRFQAGTDLKVAELGKEIAAQAVEAIKNDTSLGKTPVSINSLRGQIRSEIEKYELNKKANLITSEDDSWADAVRAGKKLIEKLDVHESELAKWTKQNIQLSADFVKDTTSSQLDLSFSEHVSPATLRQRAGDIRDDRQRPEEARELAKALASSAVEELKSKLNDDPVTVLAAEVCADLVQEILATAGEGLTKILKDLWQSRENSWKANARAKVADIVNEIGRSKRWDGVSRETKDYLARLESALTASKTDLERARERSVIDAANSPSTDSRKTSSTGMPDEPRPPSEWYPNILKRPFESKFNERMWPGTPKNYGLPKSPTPSKPIVIRVIRVR